MPVVCPSCRYVSHESCVRYGCRCGCLGDYRSNPSGDEEVRALERRVAQLGEPAEIEALKALRVRYGITPADVLRSLEGVATYEAPVRLLVTWEGGTYQRVFDAYGAKPSPAHHNVWYSFEVGIAGLGSASARVGGFGRGQGTGMGMLLIAKAGPDGRRPENVQIHYGKDKAHISSVVVVPPTWKIGRKADTRKADEKPVRLGTRRSRAIFEQAVATGGYMYDGMRVHTDGPSIEYVRRADGLEADAINHNIKSMRPTGRQPTDRVAGVPGIKYTIRYHGNHWVDFVSPAEGDDSSVQAEAWSGAPAVAQARQYATEHLEPGEVYEPETVPWEPEEHIPVYMAPPAPPTYAPPPAYAEPAGLPRKCARCKAALGPGSRSPRNQSYCAACLPGEMIAAPVMAQPSYEPWEPEEHVQVGMVPPAPPLYMPEDPAFLHAVEQVVQAVLALSPGARTATDLHAELTAMGAPFQVSMRNVRQPALSDPRVIDRLRWGDGLVEVVSPEVYADPDADPEVYGPEMPTIGRADYEERRQRRMESLERQAGRARSEAASQFRRADLREEASGIPFGQPILVGHHSEGRHRRALARSDAAMRRSIEAAEHAQAAEAQLARMERQDERGTAPISSDDPEALVRLQEKLDGLLAQRDRMKAVNMIVRRAAKDTVGIAAKDVREGEAARQVLVAAIPLGLTQGEAESLARSYGLQSYHGVGYPSYAITNLGAEIRRVQDRVEGMRREALSRAEAVATGQVDPQAFEGFQLVENMDANRVQLVFGGKPGTRTRGMLKSSGFRWSPTEGAWQRQLNEAGRRAASRLAQEITAGGGYLMNPGW